MTLTELMAVVAIGAIVMSLSVTVTVSLLRHHGANLVRQERTDEVRQVSIWLGDALTYATAPEESSVGGGSSAAFDSANGTSMTFTSALTVAGNPGGGAVSRVTIVLDDGCPWGSSGTEPGVLRRCVQSPKVVAGSPPELCNYGASGCPDDLFDDFVVARGVKNEQLFFYYVAGATDPVDTVPSANLGAITALEMLVTVAGADGGSSTGLNPQATIFKRFSVGEWRRL
jgi:hypothetical protein